MSPLVSLSNCNICRTPCIYYGWQCWNSVKAMDWLEAKCQSTSNCQYYLVIQPDTNIKLALRRPPGGYLVERWVWGCAAQIGCEAKFEFKVTVHYSLWAKCTQLWPLNTILKVLSWYCRMSSSLIRSNWNSQPTALWDSMLCIDNTNTDLYLWLITVCYIGYWGQHAGYL